MVVMENPVNSIGIGREQSAGVKGILLCKGEPAYKVEVKLYDEDFGLDLDDLLDSGMTNAMGEFQLQGSTYEFMTIDPKLNVYHDCEDSMPCQRKFSIEIPKRYVFDGERPGFVYDIGVVELSGEMPDESRDCLH
uniref:Transthyretin-like family protein n=2 Tax=Bursaphelenchus xylophilus TaxID=6326 RepID=A0A1I7RII4_BURXY